MVDLGTPTSSATFDTDTKAGSPPVSRLPPLPLASVSAPGNLGGFGNQSRQFPVPIPLDSSQSQSPRQQPSNSSRSPVEDGAPAGVVRLPSITRHGFLLDGIARPPNQLVFPPGMDASSAQSPYRATLTQTDSTASGALRYMQMTPFPLCANVLQMFLESLDPSNIRNQI